MSQSSTGNGEGLKENDTNKYRRDCSILIDVGDNKKIKAHNVIRQAVKLVGNDSIIGIVPRSGNMYELTVAQKKDLDILEDGLWINGKECTATKMVQDTFVASMMYLPTYVKDQEIKSKLNSLDVEILSPIKRRYVDIEDVSYADGTRFCKVRLPVGRKSLPFTMKFSDGEAEGYYRVIHNGQCKTCTICGSNDHLKKDCAQFTCFKCGGQGHIKRFCTAEKCHYCAYYICQCDNYDEYERDEERMGESDTNEDKDDLCEKCGTMSIFCVCQSDAQKKIDESIEEGEVDKGDAEDVDEVEDVIDDENEIVDSDGENKKTTNNDDYSEDNVSTIISETRNVDTTECEQMNEQTNDGSQETVFGDILDLEPNRTTVSTSRETLTAHTETQSMEIGNIGTRKRSISLCDTTESRMKIRATEPENNTDK